MLQDSRKISLNAA